MHTTIVTQGDYEIVELESMLLETKWSNNETIRLFEEEMKSLLMENGNSEVLTESSTALNLRWMRTHLYRVGNNLDQMKTEILKWKQVQVRSENATAENCRVEKWYLEEKERAVSLQNSYCQATISQQAHEASIQELKLKFRLLQKDHKKAQHHNSERDARLQKLHEKYRTFTEMQQKKEIDDVDTVSTEFDVVKKRIKLSVENRIPPTGRNVSKSGDVALPHAATDAVRRKRPLSSLPLSNTPETAGVVCSSSSSRKSCKFREHSEHADKSSKASDQCQPLSCKATPSLRTCIAQSSTDQPKFYRKTPISSKGSGSASSESSEKRMIVRAALPAVGHTLVGRHIRKRFFGHGTHLGKITKFISPYYTILYDDGDTEEMLESEIGEFLTHPKTRNSI